MQVAPHKTNSAQSETDLVNAAQRGNADAFAALFRAHKTKVYSICLRMTNNTAEAEDLTQDTFLHVFRKLASFRGDSTFSTWLYRVTVNTVLMHFRKRRAALPLPNASFRGSTGVQPRELGKHDLALEGSVDRITMTRALRDLPVGYRRVFVLHEVKGYEHHDIARLLRCSIGTSKSQLHKAKGKIRELLGLTKADRLMPLNSQRRPYVHITFNARTMRCDPIL